MEERIKFVILANQNNVNFSGLCDDFGISRPTGYRWVERYHTVDSLSSLSEYSRCPHHIANKTSPENERHIIELRHKYGWGGKKLRILLLRKEIDIPVVTINRVLKRNDLIHPKDSHQPALKRFERQSPNELWQMDFKGDYPSDNGRCYPLSLLDDHSRYAVGLYALKGQDTDTVYNCLVHAFERYGVPDGILTDHGSPWWGNRNNHGLTRLSVRLINQGIKLYFSGIRHPQTQGKVERFHRTLAHAVCHHGRPSTIAGWQELLEFFLSEYNNVRPHEALNMDTPNEHYQPSQKAYNPNPQVWEYPKGAVVSELNSQGCLTYKQRRYFVCEALEEQRVQVEQIQNKLIVSYRQMYIREIDIITGKSVSLLTPIN
jgi:transposase InsO family protein